MASVQYCARTNYFRVKDADAFKAMMEAVQAEDEVYVFSRLALDGTMLFGFGCEGEIYGFSTDDDDYSEDDFYAALQIHIAEDDAIIIMGAGHEKLRYVVSDAVVITANDIKYMRMEDFAVSAARKALNNPTWQTVCAY